jgi:hypothetical protein
VKQRSATQRAKTSPPKPTKALPKREAT